MFRDRLDMVLSIPDGDCPTDSGCVGCDQQLIMRSKSKDDLEAWIDRAARSLVASFANGVIRDRAAVQNAITSMWSNGQTEGQITKLKLIKRQMYGRGKLDLLEARIVGAP